MTKLTACQQNTSWEWEVWNLTTIRKLKSSIRDWNNVALVKGEFPSLFYKKTMYKISTDFLVSLVTAVCLWLIELPLRQTSCSFGAPLHSMWEFFRWLNSVFKGFTFRCCGFWGKSVYFEQITFFKKKLSGPHFLRGTTNQKIWACVKNMRVYWVSTLINVATLYRMQVFATWFTYPL